MIMKYQSNDIVCHTLIRFPLHGFVMIITGHHYREKYMKKTRLCQFCCHLCTHNLSNQRTKSSPNVIQHPQGMKWPSHNIL